MDSVQPESDCQINSEMKERQVPLKGVEQLEMESSAEEDSGFFECVMEHSEESESEWRAEEQERFESSDGELKSPIMTETDIDHTAVLLPSGGTQSRPHAELVAVRETVPPQEPDYEFCSIFLQPRMGSMHTTNYMHSNKWLSEVCPPSHPPNWACPLSKSFRMTTFPFCFGTHSKTFSKVPTEDSFSEKNMDINESEFFQCNPSKTEISGKVEEFVMFQKFRDMDFRTGTTVHPESSFDEKRSPMQQPANFFSECYSGMDTEGAFRRIFQESALDQHEDISTDSQSDHRIVIRMDFPKPYDSPEGLVENLAEGPLKTARTDSPKPYDSPEGLAENLAEGPIKTAITDSPKPYDSPEGFAENLAEGLLKTARADSLKPHDSPEGLAENLAEGPLKTAITDSPQPYDSPEGLAVKLAEGPLKIASGNNLEDPASSKEVNDSRASTVESCMDYSEAQQMVCRTQEGDLYSKPDVNLRTFTKDSREYFPVEACQESGEAETSNIISSKKDSSEALLVGPMHDQSLGPRRYDSRCLKTGSHPETVNKGGMEEPVIGGREHEEGRSETGRGKRPECTEQATGNCLVAYETSEDTGESRWQSSELPSISSGTCHLCSENQEDFPLGQKKKANIHAPSESFIKKSVEETFGRIIRERSHSFLDELRGAYLGVALRKRCFHLLDSGLVMSEEEGEKLFNKDLITVRNGAKLAMVRGSSCYSYHEGWQFCVTEELNESWSRVTDRVTQEKMLMKKVSVTCDWRKSLNNFLFLPPHPLLLLPYAVVYNRDGDILYLMENRHITGIGKPPEGFTDKREIFKQFLEFLRFCIQHKLHPGNLSASMLCTPQRVWFDPTGLSNIEDLASFRKSLRTAMYSFISDLFQDPAAFESFLERVWETLELEDSLQEHLIPVRESVIFNTPGFGD